MFAYIWHHDSLMTMIIWIFSILSRFFNFFWHVQTIPNIAKQLAMFSRKKKAWKMHARCIGMYITTFMHTCYISDSSWTILGSKFSLNTLICQFSLCSSQTQTNLGPMPLLEDIADAKSSSSSFTIWHTLIYQHFPYPKITDYLPYTLPIPYDTVSNHHLIHPLLLRYQLISYVFKQQTDNQFKYQLGLILFLFSCLTRCSPLVLTCLAKLGPSWTKPELSLLPSANWAWYGAGSTPLSWSQAHSQHSEFGSFRPPWPVLRPRHLWGYVPVHLRTMILTIHWNLNKLKPMPHTVNDTGKLSCGCNVVHGVLCIVDYWESPNWFALVSTTLPPQGT